MKPSTKIATALIVTPARQGAPTGNRITAERWARVLVDLGVMPTVADAYDGQTCDLLLALHARKSAPSIARFSAERGESPIVLALTGTDLYGDLQTGPEVAASIAAADRIVVLQPRAVDAVPAAYRDRVRTVLQSIEPVDGVEPPREDRFDVCVLGHLRPVKDPFRAAAAARLLPAESLVHVTHVGGALEPAMAAEAEREASANPRYEWLGELPRTDALRWLAQSRLLVLSSTMEGGANVVGEALVHGVPVVASRIDGSVGLLGDDYPGFFPVGDTQALADRIARAEGDPAYLVDLRRRAIALAPQFAPDRERDAWRAILEEL